MRQQILERMMGAAFVALGITLAFIFARFFVAGLPEDFMVLINIVLYLISGILLIITALALFVDSRSAR